MLPMETAEPMETEVSTEPIEAEAPAETEQDEQSMTGAGVGEGMDGTSTERAQKAEMFIQRQTVLFRLQQSR